MADEMDEVYDVTSDHGPEAIGFVSSHPLLTNYIVATVMTFHRSGGKKNTNELDIRSKTAQFPDTTKGIDAVRDLLAKAGVDTEKCAIRRRSRHS